MILALAITYIARYYNFKSPFTTAYQLWYIREASVAICVGNLICTWQLFQRIFKMRSWDDKSPGAQKEPDVEIPLGPNGTIPRTIGGTPRIVQGTPEAGFRGRFLPRRDPNASLFASLARTMGRSAANNTQLGGTGVDRGNGGSGFSSATYVNDKSVSSPGAGAGGGKLDPA